MTRTLELLNNIVVPHSPPVDGNKGNEHISGKQRRADIMYKLFQTLQKEVW